MDVDHLHAFTEATHHHSLLIEGRLKLVLCLYQLGFGAVSLCDLVDQAVSLGGKTPHGLTGVNGLFSDESFARMLETLKVELHVPQAAFAGFKLLL